MVLIDKGPLPNPGGSTGHASNFIFPVDHNKEMALLGEQSADQYRDLGLSVDSGGIEVARTQERMDELQRRMTSAKAWGIEAYLLTPAEVKELVPFINTDIILGGRLLLPDCVGGGFAGNGHTDAHRGHRYRRPPGARKHRSPRPDHGRWAQRTGDHQGRCYRPRHDRRRIRGRCLWRMVQPHRQYGGCAYPPGAGRSPDGRCRPDGHSGRDQQRDRLPDRARHGHLLLRAPVGGLDGGGVLRPSPNLPPPRRHPLQRGVRAVTNRDAVHDRGLRPADGRSHRTDGHAGRRRDQVRHQRSVVLDTRCHAVPWRNARGPISGRLPRCGSRRGPAWRRWSPSG